LSERLSPEVRRALAERVRYYNELGIYDFYRREFQAAQSSAIESAAEVTPACPPFSIPESSVALHSELQKPMAARESRAVSPAALSSMCGSISAKPEHGVADPISALKVIREDLGDCTRCKLHQQGRKQIVFGVGNPHAELMFVGEGPGADEDAQGEPFVGRAGQLLNNMIRAMGLRREDVYIANIVKCRPPGNRTPDRDECETCSPFLMRQISVIKPKVIVALGAVAAKNLLAINAPMSELRGRWYDFKPAGSDPAWPGARLAVTYHPAFLLRDPRQKGETWKDLQMVMKYLGIVPPKKTAG
jgi:uracil-DNA glycosylase